MRPPRFHSRGALLALCLAGLLAAAPARAQDWPRLALYMMLHPDGSPFVRGDGTLDPVTLDQVARYHDAILDVSPITEYRPDILSELRARRPGIHAIGYVLAEWLWPGVAADSLVNIPSRLNRMVRDMDGYLYNRSGALYFEANINVAKRDSTGRYVVAEAVADFWYQAVVQTGLWDGMFLDVNCDLLYWTQSPTDSIDFVRAGYPDYASFELAWKAGSDTLTSRLRRLAGPSFLLVGNCGPPSKIPWCNGWMRENFPYQGGGSWYENMLAVPDGYFDAEAIYRAPTHNQVSTWISGSNPYDANNARKVRFGLASAALPSGYAEFGVSNRDPRTAPFQTWWYDEYAVDLSTGHASPELRHTGWLGQPLGPAYQMIWAGTGADAVTNPGFETDLGGWTLTSFGGAAATLARDAGTAAAGTASGRVDVAVPVTPDWYVTLSTTGSLTVSAGGTYAATFWARASSPRSIRVVAAPPGGGQVASRLIAIDTGWRQYQAILQPSVSTSAKLQFYLGADAGSVWLDDVHLQAGATNLYRRDFANGFVLVNPSGAPLTVPLATPARKILGTVDPATNDGSALTQVTVPASDACFLIARDGVAPAAIQDLHAVPPAPAARPSAPR